MCICVLHMCMYVYVCVCKCMYVYMSAMSHLVRIYVCVRVCVWVYVCVRVHTYVYMCDSSPCVFMCTCASVRVCLLIRVCLCVGVCGCIARTSEGFFCTYVHTNTHEIRANTNSSMHTRLPLYSCVCAHIHTLMHVCIHTQIQIHTQMCPQ